MLSHSAAQFLLPEQIEKCFQKLSDKKKTEYLNAWKDVKAKQFNQCDFQQFLKHLR